MRTAVDNENLTPGPGTYELKGNQEINLKSPAYSYFYLNKINAYILIVLELELLYLKIK